MRGWEIEDNAGADDDAEVGRHAERVVGLPPDPDDPPRMPLKASVLGSFDPGRRGVKALVVVAIVVIGIAAFLAWRARPQATPVSASTAAADGPGGAGGTGVSGGSALPSPAPSTLVVAVSGRVRKPGLVRLPAGARVADALDAAGGVLPGTDVAYLNLARKVVDGEMILVGVTPPPGAAPPPTGSSGTAGGLVNLNTATLAELQTLPGIGAVLAQRIIDYRDQHGQYRSVTELRQVSGIGDAKFAQLKDKVTV